MSTTSVLTNNRSQAVRLPADMRLPEGVALIRTDLQQFGRCRQRLPDQPARSSATRHGQ